MTDQLQLIAGVGQQRLRLYDRYWTTIWDSATASTPAYKHIATHAFSTIDYPDGSRWIGEMWRCPEGIRSARLPSPRDLKKRLKWPHCEV